MNRAAHKRDGTRPRTAGRRRSNGGSLWRRWHRRLGVAAAVFLLVIAVTGVLLNHAADWGLGDARLTGPAARAFLAAGEGGLILAASGGRRLVWVRDRLVVPESGEIIPLASPVGALVADGGLLVAAADRLLILDARGRLLDRLEPPLVPEAITAIGRDGAGGILIATPDGPRRLDPALGVMGPADDEAGIAWAPPPRPPADADERALVRAADLAVGVPLIDALAALHSGRLLGLGGRVTADLAALALVYLAASGLWLARRRNGRGGDRRNGRRG